jgi:hypothetical protein
VLFEQRSWNNLGSGPSGVETRNGSGAGVMLALLPYLLTNDYGGVTVARKARKRTVARSSVTGKFVTKSYAKRHKRTTEVERVRVGRKKR